jgi:cytidine deaminase
LKQLNLNISFKQYSFEESSEDDKKLLRAAKEAALRAYAPYSHFHVGAALLLDNGELITGNNQENVSYPAGICAERTTIFWAMSQFPNAIPKRMAITYEYNQKEYFPLAPCGPCRQALLEYEMLKNVDMTILMWNGIEVNGEIIESKSVKDLLPMAFHLPALKR